MRTLEMALIVVIILLLYATLSTYIITPKLSLKNDYYLLKEEAYSLARVLADSHILMHIMYEENPEDKIKIVVTAFSPANREFMVKIIDLTKNKVYLVKTPGFDKCTISATATVFYSDSKHNRIFVIELSLGRITGGKT